MHKLRWPHSRACANAGEVLENPLRIHLDDVRGRFKALQGIDQRCQDDFYQGTIQIDKKISPERFPVPTVAVAPTKPITAPPRPGFGRIPGQGFLPLGLLAGNPQEHWCSSHLVAIDRRFARSGLSDYLWLSWDSSVPPRTGSEQGSTPVLGLAMMGLFVGGIVFVLALLS